MSKVTLRLQKSQRVFDVVGAKSDAEAIEAVKRFNSLCAYGIITVSKNKGNHVVCVEIKEFPHSPLFGW